MELKEILIYVVMLLLNATITVIIFRKGEEVWNDLKGDDGRFNTNEILSIVAIFLIIAYSDLFLFLDVPYNEKIFFALLILAGIGVGANTINKFSSKPKDESK